MTTYMVIQLVKSSFSRANNGAARWCDAVRRCADCTHYGSAISSDTYQIANDTYRMVTYGYTYTTNGYETQVGLGLLVTNRNI